MLFWKPCEEKNDKKWQQHCQWGPKWRRRVQAEPARPVWVAGRGVGAKPLMWRLTDVSGSLLPTLLRQFLPLLRAHGICEEKRDPLLAFLPSPWHQAARSFAARTSFFSLGRVYFCHWEISFSWWNEGSVSNQWPSRSGFDFREINSRNCGSACRFWEEKRKAEPSRWWHDVYVHDLQSPMTGSSKKNGAWCLGGGKVGIFSTSNQREKHNKHSWLEQTKFLWISQDEILREQITIRRCLFSHDQLCLHLHRNLSISII